MAGGWELQLQRDQESPGPQDPADGTGGSSASAYPNDLWEIMGYFVSLDPYFLIYQMGITLPIS